MKKTEISRRHFLSGTALAMTGALFASESVFGMPAYIKNLGKPNSLFNGVQVGAITYSWRSMPGSAEDILRYCIECNISAIELMGPTAEEFAGAPKAPVFQRGPQTDEQKAARAEYAQKMAAWRAMKLSKSKRLR